MRTLMIIACSAALLAASGPKTLVAQTSLTLTAEPPAHAIAEGDSASQFLDEGDRSWEAFQHRSAERAYAAAVVVEREAERLPATALWKLAAIQYAQQKLGDAARTLDHLASLAETYGHPEVQTRALLEAVVLHHKAGDNASARRSLERLLPLQNSPHLSDDLRRQLETRLLP